MAGDDDTADPQLVNLEQLLSKKVESNSKQLQNIEEKIDSLTSLLDKFIEGQKGTAEARDIETEG